MTTENQNIDSKGAEGQSPENQNDAGQNTQRAETPQEILQRRLDELNKKNEAGPVAEQPAAAATPAPIPQQPEEQQKPVGEKPAEAPEATDQNESIWTEPLTPQAGTEKESAVRPAGAEPVSEQAAAQDLPEPVAKQDPSSANVTEASAPPQADPAAQPQDDAPESTPEHPSSPPEAFAIEHPVASSSTGLHTAPTQAEQPEPVAPEAPQQQETPVPTQASDTPLTKAMAAANEATRREEEAQQPISNKGNAPAAGPIKDVPPIIETAHIGNQPHEEDEEEEETETPESTDYSQLSLDELRNMLTGTLKSADARKKHKQVNELNRHYDQKFQAEKAAALDRFKQEQGDVDDFEYHAPQEHQDLEKLLSSYRDSRHQERQQTEAQRQKNLERKQELLTKLRELVESAETKSSGDELKKIQGEWKSIGPVPPGEAQELWDSYHALLDIFYNNRSIFYELKELDRKRNLDAKLQLIERAEALQKEQSLNKALQELRHLHEEWKNIGPVPNEQREPIWERFIQASEKIHENRRTYQEERRGKEMENLTKKRDILERLMAFQNFSTDRINEWRDRTDEIQKLKEEWDAVGLVPKEFAEEINKNFWGNYKAFFQHKNMFFKSLDEQKMHNLQIKTKLCEEAESLKESTDWNSTKEKLIQLQKQWKTIGRVPDKHSDKIWQRFRSACNEFFDRKQAQEKQRGEEVERLSNERMEICDKISEKLSNPSTPTTLEDFDKFVAQWRTLDVTQTNNPKTEEKFLKLMERYLEREPTLSYEERNDVLVKLQVERLKHTPDAGNKLHQREQAIRREIQQLQNDIQTLKTNIEFFGRSKNAEKLREEYEGRIDDAQKRIDLLQKQQQAFRA